MSRPTLIRTTGPIVPGGFQFSDPITGKQYKDTYTLFDQRVKQIINDRTANKRLVGNQNRLNYDFVARELSEYTCIRLNASPDYCTGGSRPQPTYHNPPPPQPVITDKLCPYCNVAALVKEVCVTCGGKITFTCNNCHRHITAAQFQRAVSA